MPLYEYYCPEDNGIFELLRPVREASDPQPCPVCDGESKRIMPTDFAAFIMRDGLPRRIPDQGLYWGVEGQLKNPLTSQEAKPQDIVAPERKRPKSAILSEEPPDLTDVDERIPLVLHLVTRHCLEKSPGERFHSAHDLAFQLEAISGSGSGATAALAGARSAVHRLLGQGRVE